MENTLVPLDFKVPILKTDKFWLKELSIEDAPEDYETIMSNLDYLSETKPFGPWSQWPVNDLTPEENKMSIELHEEDAKKKYSFSFAIRRTIDNKYLGVVYIYPSDYVGYDAISMMWTNQNEVDSETEREIFSIIKKWIEQEWPFQKVAYPGRDIDWNELEIINL